MEFIEFVKNNWFLFVALAIVLSLLAYGPLMQRMNGIRSVSTAQLVQLINRESAVIIDVSEPQEFRKGHLPNAINVPLGSIGERATELQKYQKKTVVVSCLNGNRSMKAALLLSKQGAESVYILTGGNNAWQRDSMPMGT